MESWRMADSDQAVHAAAHVPAHRSIQDFPSGDAITNLIQLSDQHNRSAYPNNCAAIQPPHTVYIPADQFHENTLQLWAEQSLGLLHEYRETMSTFEPIRPESQIHNWEKYSSAAYQTNRYAWIESQLSTQPIKDLRIDFEDGYGHRTTQEEWWQAQRTATELAHLYSHSSDALAENLLPTENRTVNLSETISPPMWIGVRTKGLVIGEYHKIFDLLDALLPVIGMLPGNIITFPKIMDTFQVEAANKLCEHYEQELHLTPESLRYELQIEIPRALIGSTGEITLIQLMNVAGKRLLSFPFGTYDYTAALSIAAPFQSLAHANADWAKSLMQLGIAGRNIWLSDGSTQLFPLGSPTSINFALQRHYHLVYRALSLGIYQGWDMHPGQLITRYAANYDFFHYALEHAAPRLNSYCARLGGEVTDEPATAEALSKILARGIDLGILKLAQVHALIPALGSSPRNSLEKIIHRQFLG